MESETLRRRTIAAVLGVGVAVFALAWLTLTGRAVNVLSIFPAAMIAIVSGGGCWFIARHVVGETAAAVNEAADRLADAAHGGAQGLAPPEVMGGSPRLTDAINRLLRQLSSNVESINRLALFDPVTGLANRTNFRTAAERMLAERPSGAATLMFIDLDKFKAVNDTRGHASGDLLLSMVANRLQAVADAAVREAEVAEPLIGRLSGDEFTMFFPALPERSTASWIAGRVLAAIDEPFLLPAGEARIGASIGIAVQPDHGLTLHDLMRCADAAMYRAKAEGRGRYELYTDTIAAEMARRVRLDHDLRAAIDRDEFTLVFQPQVALNDGHVLAAEALLRWNHPQDGLRLPGSFIARAEESGLMIEIGDWVVDRIARTINEWSARGTDIRLTINVSPRQIDHLDFFRRLRSAMRRSGAPAHLLELEVTEALVTHARADVIAALSALRADGATIALDDFGTGYSNLGRLRELPIDRIKIDRSLIAPIVDDSGARAMVQALVRLIHGLGCKAVAEGVETEAQVEILGITGCDAIQGYVVAAPMDERSFLAWSKGRVKGRIDPLTRFSALKRAR